MAYPGLICTTIVLIILLHPISSILSQVKSVKQMDIDKGFAPQQDDTPIEILDTQIKHLKLAPGQVSDGNW